MSFASVSEKLTMIITHDLSYDEEKKEIIAYAIETALLSFAGVILLAVFGYLLHVLFPAAIAATFGVLLRRVSGGAHFNTPSKCLIIGAVTYTLLGLLAQKLSGTLLAGQYILVAILLVCLVVVALLAPVESEGKPIHSLGLKRKLKLASMLFVILTILTVILSNHALLNLSAVLGVLYQSLTLLPIVNKKGGEKQ